jgi:hypothetical protein
MPTTLAICVERLQRVPWDIINGGEVLTCLASAVDFCLTTVDDHRSLGLLSLEGYYTQGSKPKPKKAEKDEGDTEEGVLNEENIDESEDGDSVIETESWEGRKQR